MVPRLICVLVPALLSLAAGAVSAQAPVAATLDAQKLALTARSYEHGEGVSKDPLRAVQMYCEAARAGNADAQFSLGWMYANGRGIPRDDTHAAYFFKLAARQEHPQAQRMLRYVGESAEVTPECMQEPKSAVDDVTVAASRESDLVGSTPAQRKVIELLVRLGPEYGVHPRLAFAVIRAESNFEPGAVSPKNAQGLMQLIPETSARFNVTKPFDPEQNIRGGLAYLRWLLAYFKGNVALVAAAYNSGEGTVNRYKGIPPYPETQGYVKRIIEHFKKSDHPFDSKVTDPSPELPRIRVSKLM